MKIRYALDAGGGRVVKMASVTSRDRFQAQSIWGITVYGNEGLKIDLDGHCSRNMPIRSGDGPPDFVDLQRSCLKLRFNPDLAKRLQLPHCRKPQRTAPARNEPPSATLSRPAVHVVECLLSLRK